MRSFTIFIVFVSAFSHTLAVDRSNFKTCDQTSFCKRHRQFAATATAESIYVLLPESVRVQGATLTGTVENTKNNKKLSLEVVSLKDSTVRIIIDEIDPLRKRYRPLEALQGEPEVSRFSNQEVTGGKTVLKTEDGNRIEIQHKPFNIDVYSGDSDLVINVNGRSLFKWEHYRPKPKTDETATESKGLLHRIWRPVTALRDAILNQFRPSSHPTESSLQNDTADEAGEVPSEGDPVASSSTPAPASDIPPAAGDNQTKEEEENEEGMWEETFKTHTDTKPYGPSSIGVDVNFIGFGHVYGLPEHADSFVLKTTDNTDPYRLYNFDVFEYDLYNPMALYGSVPYLIGHSASKTVSVLWLNAAETWVDIHSSVADKGILSGVLSRFKGSTEVPRVDTHWMSESGVIDIFVFLGPKPADVFRQYSVQTGVTELPPFFSIAYHQCRWNYNDREDVLNVNSGFDEHDIPMDTIWLDIEYTDGKRYFTWDSPKFPEPKTMIEEVASKGRKMVVIIDPHIKKDDNYKIYKEAKNQGFFVKTKEGTDDYEGWCWPGASMYLDFLNPVVRDWWGEQFALSEFDSVTETTFIWNDMNEPSVFNGPEVTMHKDARHYGDWEHRDIHNVYGFFNHMGTYKGLIKRSEGRLRPFILTRSFFAGSQRYAAVWTGDNIAEWSHLKISFAMLLSLSVAGIPFVGADVGGFFKNPDEELLLRWYQTGAFYPFFRAHAHIDTRRREPWLQSNETKSLIRDAIRRRYEMLPYWYTKFYEHSITGLPVVRPLWAAFPDDDTIFDEELEVMIGDSLLVRPVLDQGAQSVSVYLPGKDSVWYDWDVRKPQPGPGATHVETPLSKIPVFIRGGTIVPICHRVRRASTLSKYDPLTLIVAPNLEGTSANGTLYLDDGESYEYTKGQYIYRSFEFEGGQNFFSISTRNLDSRGQLRTDIWIEEIVVLNVRFYPRRVHVFEADYSATPLQFKYDHTLMLLTIRKPAVKITNDWRIDVHSS